ncbi:hypothetical protein [Sphingopyxis macrogoltabida]|uniref:Uncharacterized protein n=1 Tax=Sphingopyxis macrogoltabida TaxID=33050 RepID=A0A0N9UW37_SPHMC|nr:hypothetical protein [Sphingopyxis macrogoltabida]ALH80294.1 hypothetical protein AN936_07890 [Sphingopyxis macrogoltabida]
MMHRNMRRNAVVRKWDAESPDFATKHRIAERKIAEDLYQSPILAISFQRKRISGHFHIRHGME